MHVRAGLVSVVIGFLMAGTAARAEAPALKYFVEVGVPSLDIAKDLAASGFDIAGVNRKTSMVGIVVTPQELVALEALGWPLTIHSTNVEARAVDALANYTDPVELSALMDQVVAAHPDLARKITLRETLFEEQKQYAVHIPRTSGSPTSDPRSYSTRSIMPAR